MRMSSPAVYSLYHVARKHAICLVFIDLFILAKIIECWFKRGLILSFNCVEKRQIILGL